MAVKKENVPVRDAEKKFTKEQLLKSQKYRHQRDLLSALLEDNKRYSVAEVNKKIKEFLERKM